MTPDTILKWIRSGQLPARRTPGGHHRIDRRDVERVMRGTPPARRSEPGGADAIRRVRFCWEFKGRGELLPSCQACVVYELRAQRCYELVRLAPELGHRKLSCELSCDQCDYYRHVNGQGTNVLVVTDDSALATSLQQDARRLGFNLQVTDCEYACSSAVQTFRPDFAVVDCALGGQVSEDIAHHLNADPRIPFVRVVLAGTEGNDLDDCDHAVFARIDKPIDLDGLAACAAGADAPRLHKSE